MTIFERTDKSFFVDYFPSRSVDDNRSFLERADGLFVNQVHCFFVQRYVNASRNNVCAYKLVVQYYAGALT